MSRVAYLAPYAIKQSRSISPSRKPPSLEEEEIFGIVMVQSSVLALVVKIQLLKDFGVRDIYVAIKLNFQSGYYVHCNKHSEEMPRTLASLNILIKDV